MKFFRIFSVAALMSIAASGLSAKDRLVEKSGKTPDWLMTSGQDSFSVFSQDDDINAARDRCLADIRQYIVNSIASNITSVETSTTGSDNMDGLEKLYSTYNSELKTAAAKLPFLTGITLSNAQEVYWEKYRRKEDGTFYYKYHVLYPFTLQERNRLIKEFKEYDAGQYGKLVELREAYPVLSDVSMIDKGIRELEPLVEYFFDDVRKQEAESLMKTYRKAYSLISVVPVSQELGEFTYCLMLDGHDITCSKAPQMRSETATALELKPDGRRYRLTYDYSYCYPADDNYVLLSYSFPGASLKYRHEFDVSQKENRVLPVGFIEIDRPLADSTGTAEMTISLRSKADGKYSVGNVHFSVPSAGIKADVTDFRDFEGKGTKLFRCTIPLPEAEVKSARGMVSGTMDIRHSDGKTDHVTFTLPYSIKIH